MSIRRLLKMPYHARHGFKTRLTLIICLFTLIPLTLLGLIYGRFLYQRQEQSIISQQDTLLKTASGNLSALLGAKEQNVALLDQNTTLKKLMSINLRNNTAEFYLYVKALDYYLNAMDFDTWSSPNRNILIYAMQDIGYSGGYLYNVADLPPERRQELDALYTARAGVAVDQEEQAVSIYSYYTSISGLSAVLEARVHLPEIQALFNYALPEASFIQYVTGGEEGLTISANGVQDTEIGKVMEEYNKKAGAADYYVLKSPVAASGNVVLFISGVNLRNVLIGYLFFIILIYLLCCAFIIAMIILVSGFLTKRMYSIMDRINVETNSLIEADKEKYFSGSDEFSIIGSKFFDMSIKVKDYYSRILDYEQGKKEMEIKLLQERLNPHFLYNTLSSLRWAFPNDKLSEIILSMTKYYRIVLSNGSAYISLSEELESLTIYLNLQSFTYDLKFEHETRLDDSLRQTRIPKNLLQPIVENAFLHGIKSIKRPGKITITAQRDGGGVLICVEDNGAGMPQEEADRLLSPGGSAASGGYGLRNVMTRLELEYGGRSSMTIRSETGGGASVCIRLFTKEG